VASKESAHDRLPSAALHGATGRSPGSHGFRMIRLPVSHRYSGWQTTSAAVNLPIMLTVAGAAPELRVFTRTGFPFHSRNCYEWEHLKLPRTLEATRPDCQFWTR